MGGGVLGTLHSLWAIARGATVTHLERDLNPRGATVRNFGLVWVSGRAPGRELEMALRARSLWESIGAAVPGVGFRANGSLTLLSNERELEVARRAMSRDDASLRGFELLNPEGVRSRNPALRGEFIAGLYCSRDAAVESREALGALRHYLDTTQRYSYLAGRELVGLGEHAVRDHRGETHSGDHIFLCVGATLNGFTRELFADESLRAVRLNMAETSPLGRELTTSVADGDSFRYYPAFRDDAAQVLEPQEPLAAAHAVQLLVQQRRDGSLTIGDTHEPDGPELFMTDDAAMGLIEASARRIIGDVAPIAHRWSGVYHQLSDPLKDEIYYRREVAAGIVAVSGAGGRGMTLAPAIVEESYL